MKLTMILILISGGLASFVAGKIMRGEGYGPVLDILLGLVGWLEGWFIGLFGLDAPTWGYFVTASMGAVLFVWSIRLIRTLA